MISVAEARNLLQQHIATTDTEEVSLYNALGHFAAEAIQSPIDMPSFTQSAMDGYALRFEDYEKKIPLYNEGEIAAGTTLVSEVDAEHCIRIFTGGLVPPGVDTIVMQEQVEANEKHITITTDSLMQGANIRAKASQCKAGDVVLEKGGSLTPAACAMLAGLGIERIKVCKKPSIDIVVTGNELMRPPETLRDGKVYESNSFALKNLLKQMQLDDIRIKKAADLEQDIHQKIGDGLKAQVLLITGGISVGKYDLVKEALEKNGVQEIFHKLAQKPGKPLYFGKKGNTLVFGLPGNPGSVMSCFYLLVKKGLEQMMGSSASYNAAIKMPLANDFNKKAGKTTFLKGKFKNNKVEILDHQESYKLNGLAVADCFIEIPAESQILHEGTLVDVHLI